jgi:ADP-ribose pyrophosphatase
MAWKTLSTKVDYQNNYFKIHKERCEKSDGEIVEEYYSLERGDVVVVAAFTSKMELVMIEQYRQPVKSQDFEIPAGYIEPGEDIETAVARELAEETGYSVEKIIELRSTFASSGIMQNKVHFFIALGAEKTQEQNLDQAEEIEVRVTPWAEALEMLKTEKVQDLGSCTGILLAKEYLNEHNLI